jgi:hypothetical protein
VDFKLAKRTTLSYDQFYVQYQGNTSWELAGLNATLPGGTPVSYGLDPGSGPCPGLVGGVGLPNCNGYLAMSMIAPTRTDFPTEQLRFSTRYWDRASMNARVLYSGGKSTVNNFNETFNGLTTRTYERQEIDTGAGPRGQMALSKRDNVNADYGLIAELNKCLSVSDAFDYWNFRAPGTNDITSEVGGWRFKARDVDDSGPDSLAWHENWLLLGAVIQPRQMFRLNINYEQMRSRSANSATPSNTFTREAPDTSYRIRARATVKPSKWINFNAAVNDYSGKNDDPLVNHIEHNHDFSLGTSIVPMEQMSLDFNIAHDDVMSQTDICYVSATPLSGAANTGTCTAASSPGAGGPTYLLGTGYYHAPALFFSGMINYAPIHRLRLIGGARVNSVNGQGEELNPNMVPGALESKYVTPFADAEIKVAKQWAWHGNWTRPGYSEDGPVGLLPPRDVHGDIVTLGVMYAF